MFIYPSLSVWLYQCLTNLLYNVAPVYWGLWAQLSPQHYCINFFSRSFVNVLVCLGLLSWDGLTFDYNEEFLVELRTVWMTVRCPVATKQAGHHLPCTSPACVTSGMRCSCFVFTKFGTMCTLVSSVQRRTVLVSSGSTLQLHVIRVLVACLINIYSNVI